MLQIWQATKSLGTVVAALFQTTVLGSFAVGKAMLMSPPLPREGRWSFYQGLSEGWGKCPIFVADDKTFNYGREEKDTLDSRVCGMSGEYACEGDAEAVS